MGNEFFFKIMILKICYLLIVTVSENVKKGILDKQNFKNYLSIIFI